MTDIRIEKDLANATLTVTTRWPASVERVWRLWADPDQLARWWGPPSWPATVVDHDLSPGGTVNYYMSGPDGEKAHGYWRVVAAQPPHRLEFEDGFADDSGRPNDDLPVSRAVVSLAADGATTTMTVTTTYASTADLEKVLEMGMEEGMTQAISQIPALLAEG